MIDHWFWFALTMACLLWYSLVTIYVAVRGAYDIREMLRRLGESKKEIHSDRSVDRTEGYRAAE